MHRREFNLLLATLALSACASTPRLRGPLFWRAQRGDHRVYLLGAAEAKDRSWLTPTISAAFAASKELWLETPEQRTDADAQRQSEALFEKYGYERDRTFFDALEPGVRDRARAYVSDLQLDVGSVSHMRPWLAYYSINSRFWAKHPRATTEDPAEVMRRMARDAGKRVQHEFSTFTALFEFFAAMPDVAQSQYVEMLLDFLDDEKAGKNRIYRDWVIGEPSSRALDRMRESTPELYAVIQADRNKWWTAKVDALLATQGPTFILLGMNHMLGPDGVPALIEQAGIELQEIGASTDA